MWQNYSADAKDKATLCREQITAWGAHLSSTIAGLCSGDGGCRAMARGGLLCGKRNLEGG